MKNWRQIIFTKVTGFSLDQRHICRQSSNGFKQSNNLIFHSLWSLILEVLERQLLMSLVGGLPPPMYPAPSKVWLYLSLLAAQPILGARCAT